MSQWGYGYDINRVPMQYGGKLWGIPESQLETWSRQGAIVKSANTRNSIITALERFNWNGVKYIPYLQGSYGNDTNIRENSDVDLVVELTSVCYSNLTENEKKQLGLIPASYRLVYFRWDVISALTAYYGSDYLDIGGSKSLKVLPDDSNNRLKTDIVVCANYKYYDNLRVTAEGIIFKTSTGEEIVNYPKQHSSNGSQKNASANNFYKPSIRMFKNARERIVEKKPSLIGRFPSYFIECLLFNVTNSKFTSSFRDTYFNVINWLGDALSSEMARYMKCQNYMSLLFGSFSVQWNLSDAQLFVSELKELWNDW
jgi:hypothetical protein